MRVSGAGYTYAFISDEASTTRKNASIDYNVADGQFVERRAIDDEGGSVLLNRFKFDFASQGQVNYRVGRANVETNHQVNIMGVAANSEVIVYGGADEDVFVVGSAGNVNRILGPVTINSPDVDYDQAYFLDNSSLVSRNYTLRTNPQNPDGFVVESAALPVIALNGLSELNFHAPEIGNNTVNIPGSPATTLTMLLGDGDDVTLGSSAPALGGSMSGLTDAFQFLGYQADNSVSITLDDSGNNSTARNVTIEPYLGATYGLISGMGFTTMAFANSPNFTVDVRGGDLDDSFVMSGSPLAARFQIDGGAGNDILIGSGGNSLFGGAGRDLLVAGANASVLDGGLDEDILIGGTINDSSLSNLFQIRAVWTGSSDYDSRVSVLRDTRLSDDKVTGNGASDPMTGGLDALDLFFGDQVSDLEDNEYLFSLS